MAEHYDGFNSLGKSGIFFLAPTVHESEQLRGWWKEHQCQKEKGYAISIIFPKELKGASIWLIICISCQEFFAAKWPKETREEKKEEKSENKEGEEMKKQISNLLEIVDKKFEL